MDTLIVQSKNKEDLRLVVSLLKRMKIQAKFMSEEEQEDYGLTWLVKQADRSRKVSYEAVTRKFEQE